MSRIRSVHPSLFTDEDFVSLSDAAKIFFIGLWCEADDFGVFEWKPLTLKMKLMAASNGHAEPLLAELVERGRIKRFEADGRCYGVVRNFVKFQRPQKPRAVHPLPDELRCFVGFKAEPKQQEQPTSATIIPLRPAVTRRAAPPGQAELPYSDDTVPRKPNPMEEVGGRRKDEGKKRILNTHPESVAARPPAAPAGVCEDFSVLWGCWLNREGRTQAERAYAAARRQVDAATILAAADAYTAKIIAKYPAVADRERYGGLLANWLRGSRWQDWAEAEQRYDVDIEPVSEVDWRSQMVFWTNPNRGGPTRERWQVEVWGPMPGDPGCRVPPHLTEIAWRDAGAA